ncbi:MULTISPECIES: hypothetical protein [unclassified Shewanella]|uniref:hypothetical protein n=1 Tax=unclassified Shewanella TaxID=196818 RepID=UPI00354D10BF
MNHVYKTANRYYQDFESYEGVITFKSIWVLLSLLAFICMGYSFFWYMNLVNWPESNFSQLQKLFFALGFEATAILCSFRLQSLKTKRVISKMQQKLDVETDVLIELKSIWFKKTIGVKNTEYIELAEKLDTFLTLKTRHKSSLALTGRQFGDLFFSNESKNRILAMFMGLTALSIALCIAGGVNINTIFSLYENTDIAVYVFYICFFSILILGLYLVFRFVFVLAYEIMETLLGRLDGLKSTSDRRIRIFINQLLSLHVIEKAKVKKT